MQLNGKQTIFQMMQLADEVTRRGGAPREPLEYKHQYHDLLWRQVGGRVEAVRGGTTPTEELTVPGSELLRLAKEQRGKLIPKVSLAPSRNLSRRE